MPLLPLEFKPGVNTMISQTANKGGWSLSNRVRFLDGLPEKIGGWISYITNVLGVCRTLFGFNMLNGAPILSAGTSSCLYLYVGSTLYNISPIRSTISETNGISTILNSPIVTISFSVSHGAIPGDAINLPSVSVSGLTLSGDYVVVSTPSTTTLTINAGANANTDGASLGGTISVVFYYSSGDSTRLQYWSLDNWGQTLLASPTKGPLFYWSPDVSYGVTTIAQQVTNGSDPTSGPPLVIGLMKIAIPERHCLLFGCSNLNATTNYDPLLVRFSDVENYTVWKATSTNTAGSFRIQNGSEIISAYNTTLQTLIWTDISLHLMRFIGGNSVYSFNLLGQNCGIIAKSAFAEAGGIIYWMGVGGFFKYAGGAPVPMDCTMLNFVFKNLNWENRRKVVCGVVTEKYEVTWWFPSASATENDTYVTYQYAENLWYGGQMSRSAWISKNVFQYPMAAHPSNKIIYQHEYGNDDDTSAMGDYIESGYGSLGETLMYIDSVRPDFQSLSGQVNMSIKSTDYSQRAITTHGPYAVASTTEKFSPRSRNRFFALRIESIGTGSFWRNGMHQALASPDGDR